MRKLIFAPLFVYSFLCYACKKEGIVEYPKSIEVNSGLLGQTNEIHKDSIYNWFVRSMKKFENPPFDTYVNFVYLDFDGRIRKNIPLKCAIRKIRKRISNTKTEVFYLMDFEDKQGALKRINVYDQKTEMPVCCLYLEFEDSSCKKLKKIKVETPLYLQRTKSSKIRTIKK